MKGPTWKLAAGLLALGGGSWLACAEVISGPITNLANGHIYYLLNQTNWTTSQAQAVALGGNLTTINDATENAWVLSTFGGSPANGRNLWIGLNDAVAEGVSVWADASQVGYLNWAPGEPNDPTQAPDEDYVFMWSPGFVAPGTWNDGPNSMAELTRPFSIAQPFGVVEVRPTIMGLTLIVR